MPSFKDQIEQWSEDDRADFEERAGIIEFCGGHTRSKAEFLAYQSVKSKREARDAR